MNINLYKISAGVIELFLHNVPESYFYENNGTKEGHFQYCQRVKRK